MKLPVLLAMAGALLAGCGPAPDASRNGNGQATVPAAEPRRATGWDLQPSGAGVALALLADGGGAALRLSCPAGRRQLVANVAAFAPIGSEERLSIGSGGEALALVADSSGDRKRGGVTASGAVPANLAALLAGPVSASYGAQSSGPHPAPPADLAAAFVAACSTGNTAAPPSPAPAGACLVQDGEAIPANRLRAIGTEPFWGARIEGRCVTYSHPDDQAGTRLWTRFEGTAANGSWSGALGGAPFVLRTRAAPGCSDGMSDNRYPVAVTLTVGGEQRTGCAEPLPAPDASE